jgi:putative hydrolases of HD superfamily
MANQSPLPLDIPSHSTIERILQFSYEIGAARHRPRAWQYNLQENMANVAEHCYRVTFLAMLLAEMEKADPFKAAVLAMVHDTDEIRGMDLTPYQKPYVKIDGHKAVHDTFTGTPLETLCLKMYEEYKDKSSLEALCVKDADIIDAVLELTEIAQRGSTYLAQTEATIMNTRKTSLRTKSGEQLFDAILKGNVRPWDWFLEGPSTFKDGTYGK